MLIKRVQVFVTCLGCVTLLLATNNCQRTPTSDLLDATFLPPPPPPPAKELILTTQSDIKDGELFTIKVQAIESDSLVFVTEMDGELTWDISGRGVIDEIDTTGWDSGTAEYTLQYTADIKKGEFESILIDAESLNFPDINGSSGIVTVTKAPQISYFEVTAPSSAVSGLDFSLTITAIGDDNTVMQDYDGSVDLFATGATGDLNPPTVAEFEDGIATIDANFKGFASNLQILAREQEDSTIRGISSSVYIGLPIGDNTALNFSVSAGETNVVLNWETVEGVFAYNIYRDDKRIKVKGPSAIQHQDTGLTAGQTYTYRIEAFDLSNQILTQSTKTAIVAACNTTIANGGSNYLISSPDFWDKDGSPYCIDDTVQVDSALSIQPGTVLRFASGTSISVPPGGMLAVVGSASEMITFTSRSWPPAAGDWSGIVYQDGALPSVLDSNDEFVSGSVVKFARIEYTSTAITSNISLNVQSSLIQFNSATTNTAGITFTMASEKAVLRQNIIYENTCIGSACLGGGIYMAGIGEAVLEENIIRSNSTSDSLNASGALYLDFGNITLRSNLLLENTANTAAGPIKRAFGAVYINGGNNAIEGNSFTGNESIFDETIYTANMSSTGVGAIYILGNVNDFKDNLFNANTAACKALAGGNDKRSDGFCSGAVYISGHTNTFDNNEFIENTANLHGSSGQTRSCYATSSGGLFLLNAANSFITNNSFAMNSSYSRADAGSGAANSSAVSGGVVYAAGDTLTLTNNLFEDNISVARADASGNAQTAVTSGALYLAGDDHQISKNTFTGNSSESISFDVSRAYNASAIYLAAQTGSSIAYNEIANNKSLVALGGVKAGVLLFNNTGSITMDHNNIYDHTYELPPLTSSQSLSNLYANDVGLTHLATNSFWGGATAVNCTGKTAMLIEEGCNAGTGSTVDVSGAVDTPWPRCSFKPGNSDCVGAAK